MKKQDFNDDDLQKLTDELRKLGTPYVSSEPGPQYWANFRVRVMDHIEAREERSIRSILAASRAWLSGHLLETGLAGAAALLIIFALTLNPFGTDTPSNGTIAQAPSVTQPQTQAPVQPTPEAAKPNDQIASASSTEPKPSHVVRHDSWMASHLSKKRVDKLDEMAAADVEAAQPSMITSESDYPVSLNELSPAELQAILNSMEQSK